MMRLLLFFIVAAFCLSSYAQVPASKALKVSALFSDGMVLQQKSEVSFWGNATSAEKLTITGSWGTQASVIVNSKGVWKAKLTTPKAGGPFTVNIRSGAEQINLKDILIGEVWLASGQSNMDIPLKGWPPGDTISNSKQEIDKADYPEIRFLKVPFGISVRPSDSLNANWVASLPETAGNFSATAYFFARKLYQELKVPIGIIQSSIGGTPAEAWTSKEYLTKLGDFDQKIEVLTSPKNSPEAWFRNKPAEQVPKTDEQWQKINFSDLEGWVCGLLV